MIAAFTATSIGGSTRTGRAAKCPIVLLIMALCFAYSCRAERETDHSLADGSSGTHDNRQCLDHLINAIDLHSGGSFRSEGLGEPTYELRCDSLAGEYPPAAALQGTQIDRCSLPEFVASYLLYNDIRSEEAAQYVIDYLYQQDVTALQEFSEASPYPSKEPVALLKLYPFVDLLNDAFADFLCQFSLRTIEALESHEEDEIGFAVRNSVYCLLYHLYDNDMEETVEAIRCVLENRQLLTPDAYLMSNYVRLHMAQLANVSPGCLSRLQQAAVNTVVHPAASADYGARTSANLLAMSGTAGVHYLQVIASSPAYSRETHNIALRGLTYYCDLVSQGSVANYYAENGELEESDLYIDALNINKEELSTEEISFLIVSTRLIRSPEQRQANLQILLAVREQTHNTDTIALIDELVEQMGLHPE